MTLTVPAIVEAEYNRKMSVENRVFRFTEISSNLLNDFQKREIISGSISPR
jgi:hypothetical protein